MGTPRQISRQEIRAFLEETFPGKNMEWRTTANSILVFIDGFPFGGYLPKGPSDGSNSPVPMGYFKQLARHFEAGEAAKAWIKRGRKSTKATHSVRALRSLAIGVSGNTEEHSEQKSPDTDFIERQSHG